MTTMTTKTHRLTAIIERAGDTYVSICPELNISSHGLSIEEARVHLAEAVDRFFTARPGGESPDQLCNEVYVTHLDVEIASPL
jgi:predicted RNase H-like HicB family nuclease